MCHYCPANDLLSLVISLLLELVLPLPFSGMRNVQSDKNTSQKLWTPCDYLGHLGAAPMQVRKAEKAVYLVLWVTASDPASWLPTEHQRRAKNRHRDHVGEVGQGVSVSKGSYFVSRRLSSQTPWDRGQRDSLSLAESPQSLPLGLCSRHSREEL